MPTKFINGRGADSALAINGKRDHIVMADLVAEAAAMGVAESQVSGFFEALVHRATEIDTVMRQSLVPAGILNELRKQINKRLRSLGQPAAL